MMAVIAGALLAVLPVVAGDGTLSIPPRHPYLALTPELIATARQRADTLPWARQSLADLVADANGQVARPLGELPAKGSTDHWGVAERLFRVGLAAALTGDRKYADWVRDGLLAYAAAYPGWPPTNLRCKAFTQSPLYEAMWVCNLVQAYDLVADSGALTAEQRTRIETDLLRAAVVCFKIDDWETDPRVKDLHYRCYNFQAWHLAAVGMIGLAVGDRELAEWAVNSRYGLRHLIAHDIRDDGLFWERSVGYHHFVLSALTPWLEAMRHCGVDLWNLEVPNDRTKDEDCHYVTDTTDAPKSLLMMATAPFYLAFPDLSYPALGDSDRGPLRGGATQYVAWTRSHDPLLHWLLGRNVRLSAGQKNTGRLGFLHYYRYSYRYEQVRLNGQPITWGPIAATYQQAGEALTVDDGGAGQPDHYLLNTTDAADFTLEFTLTRLKNSGPQDRAWVVWHVDPDDDANRKSFMLQGNCPQINQPYRFRLEVTGDRTRLVRDGAEVATKPTVYSRGADWHWLVGEVPPELPRDAALPLRDGNFANSGVFRNGCSLLPSTGLAVLRQRAGDFTADRQATAAALSYGPYGGGHGHPDKLSLVVHAQGRQWIPLFGSMPYETHWKAEWTAQTISANTVVIDGVSQHPTGERNVQWPADSAAAKALGQLDRFDPETKSVAATCDTVYPGLLLQRAVKLAGAVVVDDYRVAPQQGASPAARQIDYVLHVDGVFAGSSQPLAERSGPLGAKCGYQLVETRRFGLAAGPLALTYTSEDSALRVWVLPAAGGDTEVILADGLSNSPDRRVPMVVVRRRAAATRYVTVIEPVDPTRPLTGVRLDGDAVVLERAGGDERVPLP